MVQQAFLHILSASNKDNDYLPIFATTSFTSSLQIAPTIMLYHWNSYIFLNVLTYHSYGKSPLIAPPVLI